MPNLNSERFTTVEVSRQTGATLRQLQWWDEIGVICPEQGPLAKGGYGRLYSREELDTVSLLMSVRKVKSFHFAKSGMGLARLVSLAKKATMVQAIDKATLIGDVLVLPIYSRKRRQKRERAK